MQLLIAYLLTAGPLMGAILAFFINRHERRVQWQAGEIAWALEMNRINTGE
jgi:hypothetical protein